MRPATTLRWAALATLAALAWVVDVVEADTEQAQVGPYLCFADPLGVAAEQAAAHLSASWPVLKPSSSPSTYSLPILSRARPRQRGSSGKSGDAQGAPEDDELDSKLGAWIVLDLHSSNAHTLRVSWPGSFPAEISLAIFDTESMLARGGMEKTMMLNDSSVAPSGISSTDGGAEGDASGRRDLRLQRPCRRAFAQVIAWSKGVHTPTSPSSSSRWPRPWFGPRHGAAQDEDQSADDVVPLHLTLEPLLLGAAPRTAIVFLLGTLLPLLAVAWWVFVPLVLRWTSAQLDDLLLFSAADTAAPKRLKEE